MTQQTFVAGPFFDAAADAATTAVDPNAGLSPARRWGVIGAVVLGGTAALATIAYFNRRRGY
jgi:hypothetical protein